MGETEKGGACGKQGYIYLSSGDFLVQLVRYKNFDSYSVLWWLTNTKRASHQLAQLPRSWLTTSLDTRLSTCSEDNFPRRVLLLHKTPLFPLRPGASRSKLSSSQVVPTVQASNTATNTPSSGDSIRNWCHRIANSSVFALWCCYFCQSWISTRKLKLYTMDGSKYVWGRIWVRSSHGLV